MGSRRSSLKGDLSVPHASAATQVTSQKAGWLQGRRQRGFLPPSDAMARAPRRPRWRWPDKGRLSRSGKGTPGPSRQPQRGEGRGRGSTAGGDVKADGWPAAAGITAVVEATMATPRSSTGGRRRRLDDKRRPLPPPLPSRELARAAKNASLGRHPYPLPGQGRRWRLCPLPSRP